MSAPQNIVDKLEEQRKRMSICPYNLVGHLVRHNFDIGVFRVTEDDMGLQIKVEAVPSLTDKIRNFSLCPLATYPVDSLRPA